MDVALKRFPIGGLEVELETGPEVFYPTSTSREIANVVDIQPQDNVLDIGCGVGILAIYAALKGAGSVYATDVMPEACRLTAANAQRNDVADKVQVVCGNLFDPLPPVRFDVIIDDVSGIADEVARLSGWFPEPVPTGGYDGTDHVVQMLGRVREFLTDTGALYLPVSSLSNVGRILSAAKEIFGDNIEPLTVINFPFGPELREHMDRLTVLRDEGVIDFVTRKSRHFWSLQIYKAWL